MIYLYLTSRDKKKVDIVTLFEGECPLTKLTNVNALQLPWQWETELTYLINNYPNTELWLNSSSSYETFKLDLRQQGYLTPPSSIEPLIWLSHVDTDIADRVDIIRKGRKPVRLDPGVLARLHHRHKRSVSKQ